MPNGNLQQRIIDYIDYIQDEAYWRQLLTAHSSSELCDAILEVLNDESDDVVSAADLFVLDLISSAPDCGCRREFVARFHESPLINKLQNLVEAPNLRIRNNVVHTLGRTGSKQSIRFLRETFVRRKESDPLLLCSLGSEINWLTGDFDIDWFVTQCFQSSSPMTRWAGLEIFDNYHLWPEDENWESKYAAVNSLCEDPNGHVRESAQFMRDEMDHLARLSQIPTRAEKRKLRKQLEKRRPLEFDMVAVGFQKKMEEEEKTDYDIRELSKYVDDI